MTGELGCKQGAGAELVIGAQGYGRCLPCRPMIERAAERMKNDPSHTIHKIKAMIPTLDWMHAGNHKV